MRETIHEIIKNKKNDDQFNTTLDVREIKKLNDCTTVSQDDIKVPLMHDEPNLLNSNHKS